MRNRIKEFEGQTEMTFDYTGKSENQKQNYKGNKNSRHKSSYETKEDKMSVKNKNSVNKFALNNLIVKVSFFFFFPLQHT
jgi:hypothetical protein